MNPWFKTSLKRDLNFDDWKLELMNNIYSLFLEVGINSLNGLYMLV